MTLGIPSLTFNDLTSLNRAKSEINTSKSETDPRGMHIFIHGLKLNALCVRLSLRWNGINYCLLSA